MSFDKSTISVPSATEGWNLEVWQFLPKGKGKAPYPVIVMAHGLCGTKDQGLSAFAEAYVKLGVAALVLDYRCFGGSDGSPRNKIVPSMQCQDYHSVIDWARKQPKLFNPQKVGIFGTSFSGGNAFQVASEDPALAWAISQCPHVSGFEGALLIPPLHSARITGYALASMARQALGWSPLYMPAYGKHGSWAFLNTEDAWKGFELVGGKPEDPQMNRVDCSVGIYSFFYRPIASAGKIRCPILACIGTSDTMTPVGAAKKAIAKAPKGEEFIYQGGHFSPYKGGEAHEAVVKAQTDFIRSHL